MNNNFTLSVVSSAVINNWKRELSKPVYNTISKEEEKKLYSAYLDGNEAAGNHLIMANMRYAFKTALNYINKIPKVNDVMAEEIVSCAFRGLSEAKLHFDASKDVRFSSFSGMWILKYIALFFEDCNEISENVVSILDKSYYDDEEGGETVVDRLKSAVDDDFDIDGVFEAFVACMNESLTEKEAWVIKNQFGVEGYDKMKVKDIAKTLGVSEQTVLNIKNGAFDKLRRKFDYYAYCA